MKTTTLILALFVASCADTSKTAAEAPAATGRFGPHAQHYSAFPEDKPNPLDTPAVEIVEPEANGHFGPFGTAPASHRNFNGSP